MVKTVDFKRIANAAQNKQNLHVNWRTVGANRSNFTTLAIAHQQITACPSYPISRRNKVVQWIIRLLIDLVLSMMKGTSTNLVTIKTHTIHNNSSINLAVAV